MTVVEGVGDLGEPDVIVDALLGIGLHDAPREDAARMIELINASGRPVVAVDVPSGVNASTGEVPGRRGARDGDGHVRRGEGRPRDRARPLPRRLACTSRRSGSRPREHEHALVPASALLDVPRKSARRRRSTAPARCSSSAARAG